MLTKLNARSSVCEVRLQTEYLYTVNSVQKIAKLALPQYTGILHIAAGGRRGVAGFSPARSLTPVSRIQTQLWQQLPNTVLKVPPISV